MCNKAESPERAHGWFGLCTTEFDPKPSSNQVGAVKYKHTPVQIFVATPTCR